MSASTPTATADHVARRGYGYSAGSRLDLSDVPSRVVRRASIRGAVRNGLDDALASAPSRYHLTARRRSAERAEFILGVAYTHGYDRGLKRIGLI